MRAAVLMVGMMAVVCAAWPGGLAAPVEAPLNTWTIVAADPETGEVGIAGASCVAVKIDAIAALAPGQGAAVTQAAFNITNRDKAFQALLAGSNAEEVIAAALDLDDDTEDRQYGSVTLDGASVSAAGYTGAAVQGWAGVITDTGAVVAVQGNILVGEGVVADAYAAFVDPGSGDLHLADRLMRALEAGSAAGGDRRCNQQAVEQTAAATFIMVAREGDTPYRVPSFGLTAIDDPERPWLALSVNEPVLGRNPIPELRRQYDLWRAENLPACEGCDLEPYAALPEGAEADRARSAAGIFNTLFSTIAVRFYGLVAVALFAIGLILLLRRKGRL